MTFENTTNEEIIELYKKQADRMSYYNAAEGPSWYDEASAREACSAEFRKTSEEMKARGVEFPKGDWLI